jgi:hypothetical protein
MRTIGTTREKPSPVLERERVRAKRVGEGGTVRRVAPPSPGLLTLATLSRTSAGEGTS